MKPKGYWTYEKCKESILSSKTRKEFRTTHSSASKSIYRNGWGELLELISMKNKPNGYWTYEKCKEVSLGYDSITEFRKSNGGAYYRIRENNWGELYDHMIIYGDLYKRLVYVYEFSDNFCYVGLTCNIDRRNKEHLNNGDSSVNNHITKTNSVYTLLIKTDYIDVNDAVKMERYFYDEYKSNGWNMLNKYKTGSTGTNKIYWTKEKCVEEVGKYQSYSDFRKHGKGSLNAIHKNDWYDILEKNIKGYKKRKSPNLNT